MITIVRPYEPPPDYPFDDELSDENDKERQDSTRFPIKEPQKAPVHQKGCTERGEMLRARQYPEIAGLYCGDEQIPALRRFTRYNQSMSQREHLPPNTILVQSNGTNGKAFGKKSHFNFGNWTFRDKKHQRPSLPLDTTQKRNDRPASVNLSDVRGLRSRSEGGGRLMEDRTKEDNSRQEYSCRIPIRVERVPLQESIRSTGNRVFFRSQPPPQLKVPPQSPCEGTPVLAQSAGARFRSESSLEKNPPNPETQAVSANLGEHRVSKKRNRRRDKTRDVWRTKEVKNWGLDDILVWLQAIRLDEVASLFVGYDLQGRDLEKWDHQTLGQLGVTDSRVRNKILTELDLVRKLGPIKDLDKIDRQTSMFDLVRNTEFDQVLAFETALTPRDLSVTGGRMGCLQVTKVDGPCLPFKENDCLLEINGVPGEQFKSALMLTKFISDADGQTIRFVILRRKEKDEDSTSQTDSSSGISSSPLTPVENAV